MIMSKYNEHWDGSESDAAGSHTYLKAMGENAKDAGKKYHGAS